MADVDLATDSAPRRFSHRIPGGAIGVALIIFGSVVLVGWAMQAGALFQPFPSAKPIHPNSAVGFIICGLGIVALAVGRPGWALTAGLAAGLLGATSALPYVADIDVGLGGFLTRQLIGQATPDPGHMRLFAAMLFVVLGAALAGSAAVRSPHLAFLTAAIPGIAVIGLASLVYFASVSFLASDPVWREIVYTALNPSMGMALVGCGLLVHGYSTSKRASNPLPHWSAWLTGAIVTAVSLLFFQRLSQREFLTMDRELRTDANELRDAVIDRITGRIGVINRLKSPWERQGGLARDVWDREAVEVMREHPGFTAMLWIDSAYRLQWIKARDGHEYVQGITMPESAARNQAFDETRKTRIPGLSPAITLSDGSRGYVMFMPIYIGDRFDGLMAALFRYDTLLGDLLEERRAAGVPAAFYHGTVEVIRTADGAGADENHGAEVKMPLLGQEFGFRVWMQDAAAISSSVLPNIVLLGGVLLAGLLIGLVDAAVKGRSRIAASERQYRRTFESAPVAMVWVARDGRFVKTNRAFGDLLGYDAREVTSLTPGDLTHPSQRTIAGEAVRQLLTGEIEDLSEEFKCIHRDGRVIWVHVSAAAIRDEDDRLPYVLAHLQDVTARKLAEEQLFQSQKMEALGNLAGGIAHDFNNMLLPIMALTEITRDDLPNGSSMRDNLDSVLDAANQASQLVQQILTFSRHNERQMDKLDILQCTKEASRLLRNILPSTITISERFESDIGIVLADRAQLQSVVMNLGTNAVDAMDGKVGVLEVRCGRLIATRELSARLPVLMEGAAYAKISVEDSGCGMDRATLEKIFNPFFTTKPVGEGTGLGLAMVHGIIEGFSGAIDVLSEVGVGTTFEIYLPLVEGTDVATPASLEQRPPDVATLPEQALRSMAAFVN